jgi:hypothetical protein
VKRQDKTRMDARTGLSRTAHSGRIARLKLCLVSTTKNGTGPERWARADYLWPDDRCLVIVIVVLSRTPCLGCLLGNGCRHWAAFHGM